MKAYNITGKQWNFYRQYNGFDALCPVLLKDGRWVIPADALDFHENKYITNFVKSGATEDVKDIVQKTVEAVKAYPVVDISEDDLHPVQKVRQAEPNLDEKTIVETFLKATLADKYDENKTLKQALADIQAKAMPVEPIKK